MPREYACTAERFREDVARHDLTILRDDAQGRHIRFKRPDSSCYYFDLITWPGSLVIDGDCGTFAFKRLPDMFEFFRADARSPEYINPSYWSEKVTALSRHGGIEQFEWSRFEADVKDYFEQSFDIEEPGVDAPDFVVDEIVAQKSRKAEVWKELEDAMRRAERDEFGACALIRDFEHQGFRFQDWERTSREYTFGFVWNLRAIVWGIAKYDALHAARSEASNDDGSEKVAA